MAFLSDEQIGTVLRVRMDGGDKLFKHTVHHGPFLFGDGVSAFLCSCMCLRISGKAQDFSCHGHPHHRGWVCLFFCKFGRDV